MKKFTKNKEGKVLYIEEYNEKGLVIHHVNFNDDEIESEYFLEYDENGHQKYMKIIDRDEVFESFSNYDEEGNLISYTDTDGGEEYHYYDAKGRLRYTKFNDDKEFHYEYKNNNIIIYDERRKPVFINMLDKEGKEIHHIDLEEQIITTNEYDDKNRLISQSLISTNGKEDKYDQYYEYDDNDNLIEFTMFTFNNGVNEYIETYEYDDKNRLIHTFDTDGEEYFYEYDED